ncbi:MAG: GC-type dockerin domain-anchored protein, partial [Phycisphaerales bacterium]|nr:GC-type dockerin domain-anchored protein [Phycisphaerales bacterium]
NGGVNWIQGINNAGEYVYSAILRETSTPSDILTDVIVKGTVAGGISSVIVEGDGATAPELAGRTYTTLRSTTIQNDGSISFMATLSGTTATNAAFLTGNGSTVLAQKGVTIPGNAATAWSFLDGDGSSDGRGLMVSADGLSWLGTGAVDSANTFDNDIVAVNGTVAVREGSNVGSFTDPAGWAVFGSQSVPWAHMLPDGSWYVHGYNPATAGYNQGLDWVLRNGTLLTSTGAPITPGNTETWADNVLQRTFFLEAGSGNDYVVGGLTSRSTTANGTDTASDGVVVHRGGTVLVREGARVEVSPGDIRHLNFISDNRSFVAGGKLYMTASLRNATSYCNQSFSGLPSAIIAITLPASNPCPADIGQQGGTPGSDGLLNNNDFIVFIDYFFAANPLADVGQQGGTAGADGLFNNNDFIVFIDLFFAGCGV